MKITALDHLVLTVADPQMTADWYVRVLGCAAHTFHPADGSTRLALTFGSQKINLHRAGAEFRPHARRPAPGTADLCFLSEDPLEEWAEHLAAEGVVIEEGPVPRTGAIGPLLSIYVRDLDENLIEVSNRS